MHPSPISDTSNFPSFRVFILFLLLDLRRCAFDTAQLGLSSLECLPSDRDGVDCVRPPGVKGQMCDYLDYFILSYAILARPLKVMSQLFRPIRSNQGGDRDETTIALRESRTLP